MSSDTGSWRPSGWKNCVDSIHTTARPAMELSMMVVMTSWAPVRARRAPAMPPQRAPPSIEPMMASGRLKKTGMSMLIPRATAAIPPINI